mmetsp:Transcript_21414/g.43909  ORF Transcript_21414/g.43909 Transcript_21414/m.43909 type:complete len:155 (+) Transcript_21414:30-494(+)
MPPNNSFNSHTHTQSSFRNTEANSIRRNPVGNPESQILDRRNLAGSRVSELKTCPPCFSPLFRNFGLLFRFRAFIYPTPTVFIANRFRDEVSPVRKLPCNNNSEVSDTQQPADHSPCMGFHTVEGINYALGGLHLAWGHRVEVAADHAVFAQEG